MELNARRIALQIAPASEVYFIPMKKLIIASLLLLTACGQNYSNSSRVGVINKFSYKGLVYKSWEGEMNLGGFHNISGSNDNSTVVANTFAFNVKSPEVIKKVQQAMRDGSRVELVYQQWAISPITQNSDYTVTDVKLTN